MVQPFFSYPPSSPGRRSWLSQDSAYDALNAHGSSLTLCSREMVSNFRFRDALFRLRRDRVTAAEHRASRNQTRPAGERGEKGQGSARRYALFEDVLTKFIAAIKRSTPASCRVQNEGEPAGRGRAFWFASR
jgi:hypothetical protein